MVRGFTLLFLLLNYFSHAWFIELHAQTGGISITTQQDGDVYIHHNENLTFGEGFNVYRKTSGGNFTRINDTLITAPSSGPDFADRLGDTLYSRLQNDLGTEGPTATLLRFKSDQTLALLNALSNPTIAKALGRLYIDKNAPLNEQVTYRLAFFNSVGDSTGQAITGTAETSPLTINSPSNLQMSYDGNLVVAEWQYDDPDVPEKVAGFNVYRASPNNGVSEKLNEAIILHTDDESFFHTEEFELDGSVYNFYVKAVDITGQESAPSEKVRFKLLDRVPPPPVENVNAGVFENNLVEVTWPTSAAPDAAGYNVYRAPRSIDPYKKLNEEPLDLLNTVFVDSTAQPGNKYVYTVTALDSVGNESDKSTPASALLEDNQAPAAPEDLSLEFQEEDMTVQVNWNYEDPPQDFETFMLLRRKRENQEFGPFAEVNDSTLQATELEDTGLAEEGFPTGAFFQYGIVAIDSSTNFSDTTFRVFQIPDLEPPDPPVSFTAKNKEGFRINLLWNASPSKDVVQYKLFRGDSSMAELPYNERFFRDKNVEVGREYIYRVTAVDSLGNESDPVRDTIAMRDFSPPSVPRNLQAGYNGEEVNLIWDEVPNNDLAGYKIYRCDIPTGVYNLISEDLITGNSWTDNNGQAGKWYKITAVDNSGNESNRSDPAQAINVNN